MVMAQIESPPLILHLPHALEMTEQQFFDFCQENPELRIERNAAGELEIMAPASSESSNRNAGVTAQLWMWSIQDGSGLSYDSSGGFVLPNGATRSPEASWVRHERLQSLAAEEKERFLPLCPDFVVEIRSPSDRLSVLQTKLAEYIANGAQLGWLLDPTSKRAHLYRPGLPVVQLDRPTEITAEPELPGFILDLRLIW